MTERDMDERFTLDMEPEDALRFLLSIDPAGRCASCGHSLSDHQETRQRRQRGVRCEIHDCACAGPVK